MFFQKKPSPLEQMDQELVKLGYTNPSRQLQRDFARDLKKNGGRIEKSTCPRCGSVAFNGRCPSCGEKFQ